MARWAAKRRCPPYEILINLRFFYFVKQKKLDHRVIDLVPAGERVIALSLRERALLRQRTVIYQLERADIVILVGENSEWIDWRQEKQAIPA